MHKPYRKKNCFAYFIKQMSRGILIKRISKYSKIEKVISREDIQLLSKSCRSIKTAENLESSNTMCSALNSEKFGE